MNAFHKLGLTDSALLYVKSTASSSSDLALIINK